MDNLQKMIDFLDMLKDRQIYYRLNKSRDSITVDIDVPGERWEVEFMYDGTVEIEKFITTAHIYDEKELEILFRDFSD